jgi:hypothetical protein
MRIWISLRSHSGHSSAWWPSFSLHTCHVVLTPLCPCILFLFMKIWCRLLPLVIGPTRTAISEPPNDPSSPSPTSPVAHSIALGNARHRRCGLARVLVQETRSIMGPPTPHNLSFFLSGTVRRSLPDYATINPRTG